MKKIFISFFVFGLIFFVGHFVNAQKVDTSLEAVSTEISSQAEVGSSSTTGAGNSGEIEPETIGQPYTSINSPVPTDWTYEGLPGFSAGNASFESIDIDSNDIPYVVYQDALNGNRATVMKFNGTNWVLVGNAGFSSGAVEYTSIVFDSLDTPYVAYRDDGNGGKATVMKFNGTNWVLVGVAGFSAGITNDVYLVLNSNDVPYVSYEDAANDIKATVMKFNGTNWVNVGIPGFSAGAALFPSIAIGPNDIPYVSYSDDAYGQKATVMKFDGVSWVSVGIPGFSIGESHYITIAVDGSNTPYVVYSDVGPGGNMYRATSKKFDGNSWVDVGNSAGFSSDYVSSISLKIDSNNFPYVAYRDHQNLFNPKATVMKYNGTDWISVDNPCFSTNNIGAISLALNSDNIPYVAFMDMAGSSSKATVMKYPFSLTITTPNGGENFTVGQQFTASWTSIGFLPNDTLSFDLVYQYTGIHYLLTTSTANDGTEIFTIPQDAPAGQYKLYGKILNSIVDDFSDNEFSIFPSAGFSVWVPVGNSGFSADQADYTSIAIDSYDTKYVAYADYAHGRKATVMKWDGANWVVVGTPGFSAGKIYNSNISLVINSDIPYLAYADDSNGYKVTVMKFNGTSWVSVGSQGFSAGEIDGPSLAFDSSNIPYVAYQDFTKNYKATVMKLNGTNWVPVGTQGFSDGQAYFTSLVFDSNNNPTVAYSDYSYGYKAVVKKFNGTNWVPVGAPGFSAGATGFLSLKKSYDNNLYLAYQDGANGNKATVMKFNGTNWVPVGAPGFSTGATQFTSLAISYDNDLYVAYEDSADNHKVIVMKWDGIVWANTNSETFGFSEGQAYYISLVLDSNNNPYVAFQDFTKNLKATVMKYAGPGVCNWKNVGSPGFSTAGAEHTSIVIGSNNIKYVSFMDDGNGGKATVMKFNGTNWLPVGNAGFSAGTAEAPSLAIDPYNTLYISYTDWTENNKATVMKFNGANWIPVGTPGFTTNYAMDTSLVIDSTGIPYIVYKDFVGSLYKATVMKWNGTNWVLVGNAGFSSGAVGYISLAFDSNNVPFVAYSDLILNGKATVMKWNGTNWLPVGNAGFSAGTAGDVSLAIDLNMNNTLYVAYSDWANGTGKATVMKFDGTNWVLVGNPEFSGSMAASISLAIDSNSIPYVVYQDSSIYPGNKATAMRFISTGWENVGIPGFSMGDVYYISLKIDSNSHPYVVYMDDANNYKATVMRYQ